MTVYRKDINYNDPESRFLVQKIECFECGTSRSNEFHLLRKVGFILCNEHHKLYSHVYESNEFLSFTSLWDCKDIITLAITGNELASLYILKIKQAFNIIPTNENIISFLRARDIQGYPNPTFLLRQDLDGSKKLLDKYMKKIFYPMDQYQDLIKKRIDKYLEKIFGTYGAKKNNLNEYRNLLTSESQPISRSCEIIYTGEDNHNLASIVDTTNCRMGNLDRKIHSYEDILLKTKDNITTHTLEDLILKNLINIQVDPALKIPHKQHLVKQNNIEKSHSCPFLNNKLYDNVDHEISRSLKKRLSFSSVLEEINEDSSESEFGTVLYKSKSMSLLPINKNDIKNFRQNRTLSLYDNFKAK